MEKRREKVVGTECVVAVSGDKTKNYLVESFSENSFSTSFINVEISALIKKKKAYFPHTSKKCLEGIIAYSLEVQKAKGSASVISHSDEADWRRKRETEHESSRQGFERHAGVPGMGDSSEKPEAVEGRRAMPGR